MNKNRVSILLWYRVTGCRRPIVCPYDHNLYKTPARPFRPTMLADGAGRNILAMTPSLILWSPTPRAYEPEYPTHSRRPVESHPRVITTETVFKYGLNTALPVTA